MPTKEKQKKETQERVKQSTGPLKTTDGAEAEEQRMAIINKSISKWINEAVSSGISGLRDEYRSLAKYTCPEMTVEAFTKNNAEGRNRYQDVPCQDQDRVVLSWPKKLPNETTYNDYIHANYVSTPKNKKRFICTQGPLENTKVDFWRMVIQEETATIVMLCNFIECNKYKCIEYWPHDGKTITIEKPYIQIMMVESGLLNNDPSIRKSKLRVKFQKDGNIGDFEERDIMHYHWLDWPDRGVPPCNMTAMDLLSSFRGSPKPVVVHCSAGIGRTGSIVAIEYILQRLYSGQECLKMADLLKELRKQRAYSIQNEVQYFYINRILLYYFLDKYADRFGHMLETKEAKDNYKKFVQEYNEATGC